MLSLGNTVGLVIIGIITVYLNGIRGDQPEKRGNINSAPPGVMNLLDSSSRYSRKKTGLPRHQFGLAAWQARNKRITKNYCNLNNNNDNNKDHSGVLHALSIRFRRCRNFFQSFRKNHTKANCNPKKGNIMKTRSADPTNSDSVASGNHQNDGIVDLDNDDSRYIRRTMKFRRRAHQWLDDTTSSDEEETERPARSNPRAKMQSSGLRRPTVMQKYSKTTTTEMDSSSAEWSISDVTFDDLCWSTSQNTGNENFNDSNTSDNDHRLQSNTSVMFRTSNPPENKSGNLDVNFCPISESIKFKSEPVSELSTYDRNMTSKAIFSHQSNTKERKKENSPKPNASATDGKMCCIPDNAGDDSEITCKEKVALLQPLRVGIATVRSLDFKPTTQLTLFNPQSSLTINMQRGKRNERNPLLKDVPVTTAKKTTAPINITKTLEKSDLHNTKDTGRSQSATQNFHISHQVPNKSTASIKADNNKKDLEQTKCRFSDARHNTCVPYRFGRLAHKPRCIDICAKTKNQTKSSLVRKGFNDKMQRVNNWVAYNDTVCSSLSSEIQSTDTASTSLLHHEVDELERVRQLLEVKPDFVLKESENMHSVTTVKKSDVGLYIPYNYRKFPNHKNKRTEHNHNEVATNPFNIDHHDSFFESEEYGDLLEYFLIVNKIEMDNGVKRLEACNPSGERNI